MIIKSLIDTDLYKFTVMQFAYHRYPNIPVEYEFVCRTQGTDLISIKEKIQNELDSISTLKFSQKELDYLATIRNGLFKKDFINYLRDFSLKKSQYELVVKKINDEEKLILKIKGNWLDTALWEIPCLAGINEIYFAHHYPNLDKTIGRERTELNIKLIQEDNIKYPNNKIKIIEFGTRRRFSAEWQREVYSTMLRKIPENMVGTSNLLLAMETNTKPIGTHPHECFAFFQGIAGYFNQDQSLNFQQRFMNEWFEEYGEELSVYLTDIYNTDIFLESFNEDLTKKSKGLRHDSSDPKKWFTDKIVPHYAKYNVSLLNKSIVFSDSLNVIKALDIKNFVNQQALDSYGIGTELTNNLGVKSINIVMKMVKANGKFVIKISDETSKAIGDKSVIDEVKKYYAKYF